MSRGTVEAALEWFHRRNMNILVRPSQCIKLKPNEGLFFESEMKNALGFLV